MMSLEETIKEDGGASLLKRIKEMQKFVYDRNIENKQELTDEMLHYVDNYINENWFSL